MKNKKNLLMMLGFVLTVVLCGTLLAACGGVGLNAEFKAATTGTGATPARIEASFSGKKPESTTTGTQYTVIIIEKKTAAVVEADFAVTANVVSITWDTAGKKATVTKNVTQPAHDATAAAVYTVAVMSKDGSKVNIATKDVTVPKAAAPAA